MKPAQIILPVAAFGLGIGIMAAFRGGDDGASKDEVAELRKELAELKSSSPAPLSAVPEPRSTPLSALPPEATDGKKELPADASPEERITAFFDGAQGREMMKGLAGVFKAGASGAIDAGLREYKTKLDLTDAQSASIKTRMSAMLDREFAAFQEKLNDESKSMREIGEEQGDFWQKNEEEIEGMLREELSAEQYEQFEREQLVDQTERVQRRADWELGTLDRALDLDESQEDQVFGILVRQSGEYDESMAIEGVEADLPPAATAEGVSKEDAIRSVLTPEQAETYNARVESGGGGGFGRRGRGPFGGR